MTGPSSPWGDAATRFFFELTPDRILDAVEAKGYASTGRCLPMASFENRVYEIELETEDPPRTSVVAKFYRPGRWDEAQIRDEHQFLRDLVTAEVPVVAPLVDAQGETLYRLDPEGILFTVFPKVGGRSPDELGYDQLAQIGRLLARLHTVGKQRPAPARIALNPQTYGWKNLAFLLEKKALPSHLSARYQAAAEGIFRFAEPLFEGILTHRIHGDFHFGNLILRGETFFAVDFDDMVTGPPVQDLWLLLNGSVAENLEKREWLLEGYESLQPFPRETFRLIEPLRALRWIHFSAWIAKRWEDPAFPRAFPHFGTDRYWEEQTLDLENQLNRLLYPPGLD